MPPVFVSSEVECDQLLHIAAVTRVRAIAEKADRRLVGIGQIDKGVQLHVDGFITRDELPELTRQGAAGEVTAWAYDAQGRVTSVPHRVPAETLTVGAALGTAKVTAIRAALKGQILNGLITDEATAQQLLR